jgi:hypothetical protein
MSKPDGPGVMRASATVVEHFGQSGRERENMVLRLVSGGSVTELSVTDTYRDRAVMSRACSRSRSVAVLFCSLLKS